ncbi:MAG: hypothetical protein WBW84_00715 [Acidobacteriaceae bacterium]
MGSEVYSWRVSTELKQELEREARRRKASVSSILDLAAREWLKKSRSSLNDDEEQMRLHAAVAPCIGSISGGDPYRSEKVSEIVRERLKRRYGR